jgi:hypothetical protein
MNNFMRVKDSNCDPLRNPTSDSFSNGTEETKNTSSGNVNLGDSGTMERLIEMPDDSEEPISNGHISLRSEGIESIRPEDIEENDVEQIKSFLSEFKKLFKEMEERNRRMLDQLIFPFFISNYFRKGSHSILNFSIICHWFALILLLTYMVITLVFWYHSLNS